MYVFTRRGVRYSDRDPAQRRSLASYLTVIVIIILYIIIIIIVVCCGHLLWYCYCKYRDDLSIRSRVYSNKLSFVYYASVRHAVCTYIYNITYVRIFIYVQTAYYLSRVHRARCIEWKKCSVYLLCCYIIIIPNALP